MATNPTGFAVDAFLCDSAVVADGKLYVQGGGWNILTTNQFPFAQSRIGIAVAVSVPYTATNQNHRFTLHLDNADGGRLALGPAPQPDADPLNELGAPFNVGRPPQLQAGEAQVVSFALNLDQLIFEGPGNFAVVIEIDGDEIVRMPFRVTGPLSMLLTG